MTKLTKRQNEILTLIQTHMAETGSPPTRAEIAKTMGFKSPNAAEDHLRALARKGVIELVPGTSRGIRLTRMGVPIISQKITKQPLLSEEHISGYARLDRNFFQSDMDCLLHITSSEFQSLNILSGDYVAVSQANNIPDADILVVRNNNELTLRRANYEIQGQNLIIEGKVIGLIRSYSHSHSILQ